LAALTEIQCASYKGDNGLPVFWAGDLSNSRNLILIWTLIRGQHGPSGCERRGCEAIPYVEELQFNLEKRQTMWPVVHDQHFKYLLPCHVAGGGRGRFQVAFPVLRSELGPKGKSDRGAALIPVIKVV
jgi:hypothetical protein